MNTALRPAPLLALAATALLAACAPEAEDPAPSTDVENTETESTNAESTETESTAAADTEAAETPQGVLLDHSLRPAMLARLEAGEITTVRGRDNIVNYAEQAMGVEIRPVTAGKEGGERLAPSGDPNDYVSLSPYWWPNPDTDDGLPYVRRDGVVNPERHEYDTPKLSAFSLAVRRLGFGYWVTGDEKYAERAAAHLRAWFIDPETRMTPRMRYSQFVPGVSDGRAVGIIDTNRLRWVPDAMIMITGSEHWSDEDMAAARTWFGEYADWMMTSELGAKERSAENNHGTWFAAQAMAYAATAGTDRGAEIIRTLAETIPPRIDEQIEPGGIQPEEVVRTRSLHYHEFNLRGLFDISKHTARIGVDVAGFVANDGSGMRPGLDFLVPYFTNQEDWPHEEISDKRPYIYYQMFRTAAYMYDEPQYEAFARSIYDLVREEDLWVDIVMPAKPSHLAALGVDDPASME